MAASSRRPFALVALAAGVALLVAGCGSAVLSLAVPDLVIRADTTAGAVCYEPGEVTSRVGISSATFSATATYRSTALVETSTSADVVVYARATPPPSACVLPGAADEVIGGPFTLTLGEPRTVTVGAGDGGARLAALVRGDYWIGVSVDGGVALGGERSIHLEQARVSVRF